ncbi:MAG: hypothetical protein LBC83_04005 [Oscillospiraceae bacterium]|nr:hypothetical protein [Oscillospiraceae bacterium]
MKRTEGTDGGGLARLLARLKISKWQAIVIGAGLLGILLLCLSAVPGGKSGAKTETGAEAIRVDLTDYEEQLERRLAEILSAVEGAGETRVMLTLDCGSEPIYATQGKSDQSAAADPDGSQESFRTEKEYVILGTGGGEKGLILKTLEPKVRGVAILCKGADSIIVRQSVMETAKAVLGVGASKISVSKLA